jgi:hypothetical protein
LITVRSPKNKPTTDLNFTNYRRGRWGDYRIETDQHLADFEPADYINIDAAYHHFTGILVNAGRRHIPRGNFKTRNPNFSPDIKNKIIERDTIRHQPFKTQDLINRQAQLTADIDNLIELKQQENLKSYLDELDPFSSSKKFWRQINSIHNSTSATPSSHASLTDADGNPLSPTDQANKLIKYYSSLSRAPGAREDRRKIRKIRIVKIDPTLEPQFTFQQVSDAISKLKNSGAVGPDLISNYHLKHLGNLGRLALTKFFNHSIINNAIPNAWKEATIIPLLKPGKSSNLPSSFRPISLLCTSCKVMERLILNEIGPSLPTAAHQHGYKPEHSTTTYLSLLSQAVLTGFNHRSPPLRTVMVTIDLQKAFDKVPRILLSEKIINCDIHNNYKKWLTNLLTNRSAKVSCLRQLSVQRRLPNGVPQGAVLSPSLFNLYTHDFPPPPGPHIIILSYADDITILSQSSDIKAATAALQQYLLLFQEWLDSNRLTASPEKSSVTLFTPDSRECNIHPNIHLHNAQLPLVKYPKILGVRFDPMFTMNKQVDDLVQKSQTRINALRCLTGTKFGCQKETILHTYKQFVRPVLEYASPAIAPPMSLNSINKLQKVQNKCMRIATGCVRSTPISHLHDECETLPLGTHLDQRGCQFLTSAHSTSHPCHHFHDLAPRPRRMRETPGHYYHRKLSNIIITDQDVGVPSNKDVHTHFVAEQLIRRPHNTILNDYAPIIDPSENQLTRRQRVDLARLRADLHPNLAKYKHIITPTHSALCPHCNIRRRENTHHFLLRCPNHTQQRQRWGITSLLQLWERQASWEGWTGIFKMQIQ